MSKPWPYRDVRIIDVEDDLEEATVKAGTTPYESQLQRKRDRMLSQQEQQQQQRTAAATKGNSDHHHDDFAPYLFHRRPTAPHEAANNNINDLINA
jgi:hypothetical protein